MGLIRGPSLAFLSTSGFQPGAPTTLSRGSPKAVRKAQTFITTVAKLRSSNKNRFAVGDHCSMRNIINGWQAERLRITDLNGPTVFKRLE